MSITQQIAIKTVQVEEPTDNYVLNTTLTGMELKVLRVIVGRANTDLFDKFFYELSEFCASKFDLSEMDRVREVINSNLSDKNHVLDLRSLT